MKDQNQKIKKILYAVYTQEGLRYDVPSATYSDYNQAADFWRELILKGELAFLKCVIIDDYDALQKELDEMAKIANPMALFGAI